MRSVHDYFDWMIRLSIKSTYNAYVPCTPSIQYYPGACFSRYMQWPRTKRPEAREKLSPRVRASASLSFEGPGPRAIRGTRGLHPRSRSPSAYAIAPGSRLLTWLALYFDHHDCTDLLLFSLLPLLHILSIQSHSLFRYFSCKLDR